MVVYFRICQGPMKGPQGDVNLGYWGCPLVRTLTRVFPFH